MVCLPVVELRERSMKIGLIRCMQTEEMCPAVRCFEVARTKKDAFAGIEDDIEFAGLNTCGGCPGKKAGLRASNMVKRGADTIVIASCISKGTPIGFACPFAKKMKDVIRAAVGESVRIIDYTHEAKPAP